MSIVGGLDIHRKQITFDYADTGRSTLKWPHCSTLIWPQPGVGRRGGNTLIWPHRGFLAATRRAGSGQRGASG